MRSTKAFLYEGAAECEHARPRVSRHSEASRRSRGRRRKASARLRNFASLKERSTILGASPAAKLPLVADSPAAELPLLVLPSGLPSRPPPAGRPRALGPPDSSRPLALRRPLLPTGAAAHGSAAGPAGATSKTLALGAAPGLPSLPAFSKASASCSVFGARAGSACGAGFAEVGPWLAPLFFFARASLAKRSAFRLSSFTTGGAAFRVSSATAAGAAFGPSSITTVGAACSSGAKLGPSCSAPAFLRPRRGVASAAACGAGAGSSAAAGG